MNSAKIQTMKTAKITPEDRSKHSKHLTVPVIRVSAISQPLITFLKLAPCPVSSDQNKTIMAAFPDSRDIFNNLSSRITQLSFARAKNDRDVTNTTLNELNSLNYKYPVVTNPTKAVLLVNQCCCLIPPEDQELVLKCSQLITNLITRQNVAVDGRTLTMAVSWCLKGLKGQSTDVDVMVALDALLRGTTGHYLIAEVMNCNPLMECAYGEATPEAMFFALQCLEACTVPQEDAKATDADKFHQEFQNCFDIFLAHATRDTLSVDKLILIKTYIVCLRGLQNVARQRPEVLVGKLGRVLGVVKSYMLLGIGGVEFIKPQKLMPSPLSIPEISTPMASTREKGGKMTKHRKPKTQAAVMKVRKAEKWDDDGGGYTPATSMNACPEDGYSSFGNSVRTSDSDFSDTESGNMSRLAAMTGRLRQAALGLFLHTVKLTDRTVMFSFWSSFIPENPLTSKHNLITCILKETSNRGRMAALNALLLLLSSCKLYLAQAEKGENLAFTPFSAVLGLTIKELHKCLSLALTANSVPVLTLVLKCFAALVQATPYHRLSPGLVTKVIRNVKPFIYHKDSTVQVTALIVLGCVLASEPRIPETKDALVRNLAQNKSETKQPTDEPCDDSFDFVEFSSDDDDQVACDAKTGDGTVPWLLDRCLFNLDSDNTVPTPVKLESLQIVSVLSRNHFETLVGPYLSLVTKSLDGALASKYADVQLHAGRAVDFLGQAIERSSQGQNLGLNFWQTLLNGSLTALLHNEEQGILRAIGCDCLGSIGPGSFQQLSRDKQILCVTLLFACSRDEENSVRGAAVRALAICVLYPALREDSGFVVDTAETIYRVLQDETFTVRIKASWALGNLSDALVLNKSTQNLMEEFPESLILKLLKATIKASNDNDKIKMNTVRALGNFLQLVDDGLIGEKQFKEVSEEGINVLVKNCTSGSNMKVRWNSCYAVGNAMKNPSLFSMTSNWQEKVFAALTDLVVNFRNFKVRINAAVALSAPKSREFYGQFYQPIWVALIRGLETSQNMEDFNEYKHRDNLIEQICLSLGHLMTLLTKEDLLQLKDSIILDHLQAQMRRVWERLLPEKSTVLVEARSYVTKLSQSCDLSAEQKSIVKSLSDALKHDCT